jgi:hypothetical protein
VIVAADTDFGDLLASREAAEPSVVLFHRQTGRRPREQAALLLANLASIEADLRDGAIVVVEGSRCVCGRYRSPILAKFDPPDHGLTRVAIAGVTVAPGALCSRSAARLSC